MSKYDCFMSKVDFLGVEGEDVILNTLKSRNR